MLVGSEDRPEGANHHFHPIVEPLAGDSQFASGGGNRVVFLTHRGTITRMSTHCQPQLGVGAYRPNLTPFIKLAYFRLADDGCVEYVRAEDGFVVDRFARDARDYSRGNRNANKANRADNRRANALR